MSKYAYILIAILATSLPAAEITLSWRDQSTNEEGFVMQRSIDGVIFGDIGGVGPNVTTMTDDPPLDEDVSYRVRAVGRHGDSGYSNVVVENTRPPEAPSDLKKGNGNPIAKFFKRLRKKRT